MSLHTRNHDDIQRQLQECLRTCEDTLKAAKESGLRDVVDQSLKTYSDIIDAQQNFQIYVDTIQRFDEDASYDEIMQAVQQTQAMNANNLRNEKNALLSNIIQTVNQSVEEASEDEITIEGGDSAAGLICPLTQKLPDFPVVSRNCHHVFERDAILRYIQENTNRRQTSVECPFAGCTQQISRNSLYEDPDVTRRVNQAKQNAGNDYEMV